MMTVKPISIGHLIFKIFMNKVFGLFLALFFFPTGLVCAGDSAQPVILQLPWFHQFQFAGYYAALEQGFYKDAGLDVTIQEGTQGINPADEVFAGRADYGVGRSEIVLHRLNGKPLVVLASVFQHSAIIFLTKKESGINTPQDMIGRRGMLLEGDNAAEYLAVFRNEGVPPELINILPSSFNIDDLIEDKTDVFNGYSTNEPYYLQEKNIPYTIIKPTTYGIDFYGDSLFTSEKKLSANGQQVKDFRSASLRGWQYALDHPEEIIDLLLSRYGVKKSRSHLLFEAEFIKKLVMANLVEIGHINPGRWQHMADTYVELGLASPGYSLAGFLYDPNPKPDLARFIRFAVIMVIVVVLYGAAMLIFFNYKLKRTLERRTDELEKNEKRFREIFNNMENGVAIYEAVDNGNDFIINDLNPTL